MTSRARSAVRVNVLDNPHIRGLGWADLRWLLAVAGVTAGLHALRCSYLACLPWALLGGGRIAAASRGGRSDSALPESFILVELESGVSLCSR